MRMFVVSRVFEGLFNILNAVSLFVFNDKRIDFNALKF